VLTIKPVKWIDQVLDIALVQALRPRLALADGAVVSAPPATLETDAIGDSSVTRPH